MEEKNILAYFMSPEEAEEAAARLKGIGVTDLSIDRISQYPGEGPGRMNPITGDIPSLGDLTLDADFTNKSAAILAAADVSASGMSDGGDNDRGGLNGRDILLTVVVPEGSYQNALEAVKACGGLV